MANNDIHIGFDMDGVLVDHTEWKLNLASRFGYQLTAAQTTSDAMRAYIPDEHRREIRRMLYQDPDFALLAAPMHGVHAMLSGLRSRGVPYALISRRRDHNLARQLLERLGLRPAYFSDENTFFVASAEEKDEVCAHLGITLYLDDEQQVLEMLKSVPNRFLMDPHGMGLDTPWTRVSTLEEFRDYISTP